MAKLVWDQTGDRLYETGVDNVALFVKDDKGAYGKGTPWNGVVAITESPSGAEANAFYADNMKYLNLLSSEEFGATIEAYMYPDEFAACDGSASPVPGVKIGQQKRSTFGLVYRTKVGNDAVGDDYGYKLHVIYNASAAPSERSYNTVNESPEPNTMSWEVTTTPEKLEGYKPTAHIEFDSTKLSADKMALVEAKLYGSESEEAMLPSIAELIALVGTEG